ncbi:uncharacterized protein [Periplaneta americana]|uniref:uncharacterized protein n=1 Tax=Periplaneta americana TaxID=6978 RepID=UPI0037E93965
MQKLVSTLALVIAGILALVEAARVRRDEKYTSRYDNIDIDEILASARLLDNYVKCLLDKGRCTAEGATLKENIADAIQTGCAKCTDKQKEGAEKVLNFLYKNKPDVWKELAAKYDPDDTYFKKFLTHVLLVYIQRDGICLWHCSSLFIETRRMQKLVVVVVLVAVLALSEAARVRRADDDKYTDKYDNVNLDEILNNDRLLPVYFKCLVDKGKCTKDAAELKEHIGDALEHDCEKCTEKQKEGADKVIKFLYKNKPEMWKELVAKYDPEGVYVKKHEAELSA